MFEVKKYLKEGKMTQITPRVKKIASQIPGEGREFIERLFKWVKESNYFKRVPKKDERRLLDTQHFQRTVDQILQSRYAIACGEKTMVFITFCRAKGIPTKYVEAVGLDFLREKSNRHIHTHAFAEVFLQGKWVLVDPNAFKIYDKVDYEKCGYVKWVEGIDSRDLKDKEGRRYSWQNLEDLKKDTLTFKRRWKKGSQHQN